MTYHLEPNEMEPVEPSLDAAGAESHVKIDDFGQRILSQDELDKLKDDRVLVSEFKQQKLEKDAQKNWDLFYKRNTTNFFKDRHWTTREFEELKACREVAL